MSLDPVLSPGNVVTRSDEVSRYRGGKPNEHSSPIDYWGHSTEGLLTDVYEMRRRASCGQSSMGRLGEVFGGQKDLKIEYALVLAAVHKTLGWDYLILTIDVLYDEEEEPKSLYELTDYLSRSSGSPMSRSFQDIENYRVSRRPSSGRPTRGENILHGWYTMAMDVLDAEFKGRGWVSD